MVTRIFLRLKTTFRGSTENMEGRSEKNGPLSRYLPSIVSPHIRLWGSGSSWPALQKSKRRKVESGDGNVWDGLLLKRFHCGGETLAGGPELFGKGLLLHPAAGGEEGSSSVSR